MGILDAIRGKFDSIKAGLEKEVAAFTNESAAYASLAIVALVAGADGEVEPEEIKAGENFVRKGDLFKAFDRQKLASTLAGFYAKATDGILKGDLFDVIAKVKGKGDVARSVVKVGIGIAKSDGDFEEEEKEILLEVVEALGLDPASFRELN